MGDKKFLKGNESLMEELLMYEWLHSYNGEEAYWKVYYENK